LYERSKSLSTHCCVKLDILSKLGTHTKRGKKVLNLSQERYVDLSKKNHVKNFKANQSK
jgi:hypothetical protein